MAVLLKNVTNSICHAFNALHQEMPGSVHKSKLKVLTANIATLLDLYGVEKGLDHFRSTSTLNFEHFRYYLLQEVFSSLPMSLSVAELRNHESRIEEICWLLCRKDYIAGSGNNNDLSNIKIITEEYLYKLFRIFCMLSDLVIAENEECIVLLHSSEAILILQQLMASMGLDYETDNNYNYLINLSSSNESFRFEQFLKLIDFNEWNKNVIELTPESIHEAIEDMYQTYIKDIIKKGYLLRRGYLLPSLKEYWFVLQPCELMYFKNKNQKDLCGSITLEPNCMVRPWTSTTNQIMGKHDKFLKFILSTGDRNFEFATMDHRSRLQWIAALQLAITYSMGKEGYQRDLLVRRRKKREFECCRKREADMIRTKHLREAEVAKNQLEQEKLARIAAESQARELKIVAIEDSRRVAELEDIKITLENLLREETQAKRDEEIVRALQARVLAEEWEKREELELLQEEQRNLLELERQKRIAFEMKQKEKEQNLREAEKKLKELEAERQRLDLELKQARFKILHSEENKELVEARLRLINGATTTRDGTSSNGDFRIRRSLSFMHTNRERSNHN